MHVAQHEMALFNPVLLLFSLSLEYLAQMLPLNPSTMLCADIWNEKHMVFALPFGVA